MQDLQVSIGQVKRDISELVNRVAFGGERVILTSRGKAKAALVSMEDYERLTEANDRRVQGKLEAWMRASDQLVARIHGRQKDKPLDADSILAAARADLEDRHDFLRGD